METPARSSISAFWLWGDFLTERCQATKTKIRWAFLFDEEYDNYSNIYRAMSWRKLSRDWANMLVFWERLLLTRKVQYWVLRLDIDKIVTQSLTRDATLTLGGERLAGFKNWFLSGIAVKTSMDPSQTVQYTALISGITKQVWKQQTKYIYLAWMIFIFAGSVHGQKHRHGERINISEDKVGREGGRI